MRLTNRKTLVIGGRIYPAGELSAEIVNLSHGLTVGGLCHGVVDGHFGEPEHVTLAVDEDDTTRDEDETTTLEGDMSD